jgi:hypothetical protein
MKKKFLLLITILSCTLSFSQNIGVGVKLGVPMGISLKKHFDDKALEFIIGRAYYWNNFDYDYKFYHDNRFKNKGYVFVKSYERSKPVAMQLHYLIHKDVSSLDGLKWYAGFGGQFRFSSYYYDYWDDNGRFIKEERITDIGIGPDGVFGLEYTFDDVPISLALDAVLYIEIVDHPFLFLGQGGLAARYNF